MSSTGTNGNTGQRLSDWDHVVQSVETILTTPVGTRVMRRDFGSKVPDLVDAKMTRRSVIAVYSAAAEALADWEPRFRLVSASIDEAGQGGAIRLSLAGIYFPRGHLGDWSEAQDATTSVRIGARV